MAEAAHATTTATARLTRAVAAFRLLDEPPPTRAPGAPFAGAAGDGA